MERPGLWSRLGLWFKGNHRPTNDGVSDISGLAGSLAVADVEPPAEAPNPDQTEERVTDSPRTARVPANAAAEPPDDGQVRLIESLEDHFQRRDEQSKRIETALSELSQSVRHLPESSRSLLETLGEVSRCMADDAKRLNRWEQPLAQLPKLADAQREAMVSVARHLDQLRQSVENESRLLEELNETALGVGTSTRTAMTDLKRMHMDSTGLAERVLGRLESQTKRLTLFAIAVMAMTLAAVVISLVALLG